MRHHLSILFLSGACLFGHQHRRLCCPLVSPWPVIFRQVQRVDDLQAHGKPRNPGNSHGVHHLIAEPETPSGLWRQSAAETRSAIKRKRTLMEAVEEVGWTERGNWVNFESYHRRNVTTAYTELEWEE